MRLESLENRLLLAVYTTYVGTKVTVTTTGGNDTVVISMSYLYVLNVSVNGVVDFGLNSANLPSVLTAIEVQLGAGADNLTLGASSKPILVPTTINGASGNDTITGGAGNDQIFGGAGNDSIDGNLGADSVSGGLDNDTMSYATRSVAVNVNMDLLANDGQAGELDWVGYGTTDIESVMGGSGNDILTGNSLGNFLSGGAGADSITAGAGNDTLVGGAGVDTLLGGDDADAIFARDGEIDVIDGGAGIDSADTDPGESLALPSAPLASPSIATTNTLGSMQNDTVVRRSARRRSGLFAVRRIRRPRSAPIVANSAPGPLGADPLPASDVEGGIDASNLPQILQALDAYAAGQVLVTRDSNGVVNIGGTAADDQFEIRVSDDPAGPIRIYNNGGLTEFFLPTPELQLHGNSGSDGLTVGSGAAMTGQVQITPDKQQAGAGTVMLNSHAIFLTQPGQPGVANVTVADVHDLTYVTPLAQDTLSITGNPGGMPQLGGQSDALALTPVGLSNVAHLTLNTAANDPLGNPSDTINVQAEPTVVLPQLTLLAGTLGSDTLNNAGQLALANNPRLPGAQATLTVNSAGPAAKLTLLAPQTELAALNIQIGNVTLADGGNKVLSTGALSMSSQATLDVRDNSLVVDYTSPPGTTAMVAGLIQSAYNPGAPQHWAGPGITSSIAAADSSKGVGYGESSTILGPGGGVFNGLSVDGTATLVSFTLNGDATLDHHVNFNDLVNLAQSYNSGGPAIGWYNGDFNFDQQVNFNDLVPLAQNYNTALNLVGGAVGQYFEAPGNANYDRDKVSSSTPVGVRIDPQIDFLDAVGGTGQEKGPFNGTFNGANVSNNRVTGTGLADDQFFTARWEGTLTVPTDGSPGTENISLFTRSDDGIRVILGDTNSHTVIDHWYDDRGVPGLPGDTSAVLSLVKGQSYPIVVEFNQGVGGAAAGLYWKSNSLLPAQTIVPMFDPDNPNAGGLKRNVDLPVAPSNLAVVQAGGQTETLSWVDNSNNEARFRIDYKLQGAPDSYYVIGGAYAAPNATSVVVPNLVQNTTYIFRVVAINFAGAAMNPVTIEANTGSAVDLGPGLIGEYREAPNNTGYIRENVSNREPVGIRVDSIINFIPLGNGTNQDPNGGGNMNGRLAGTGLADDLQFTVRWEGVLKVPGVNDGSFGTYTLHVRSDDGERMWVNGIKITDQWNADRDFPAQPGDFGTVTVRHGTEVPIVLEFNQGVGGAGAVLYVENAAEGIPLTIIPTSYMQAKVALPANPTNGSGVGVSPVQVMLNWTDNALNEARYRIEQAVEISPGVFGAFAPVQFVTPVYDVSTGIPVGTGAGSVVINNLAPGTNYKFRIYAMNYAGDSAPLEVSASTPTSGAGVIAQYFNSPTPTNNEPYFYNRNTGAALVADLTRVDTQINTDWGTGSPDPLINVDNFMARYSGKITIGTAGNYTFRVNSDDASYAWVNGRLVSQYPGGHGASNGATNFPIILYPGTYPILFEYAEGGVGAVASLYYSGPDTGNVEQIVPTSVLTAASDLPLAANSLSGTGAPTSIALTWNDFALNEYLVRVEYKLHSASTWTVAQTYDVINNPNSVGAPQALTINGLVPNTQYDVRVIDTNFAGDGIATITVNTQNVPPGQIVLKNPTLATGDHNLTTEGNLDWIHFGYPNDPTKVHAKGGLVGPLISPYTVIGGGAVAVTPYTTTGDTFTWTDAAGGAVSTNDVTNPGDTITGIPNNGNGPNEDVTKAIDNNTATKYLNFTKLGTGLIVTPAAGASLIGGISLTSANDAPERDPTSYEVWGSNDGGVSFTLISSGAVPIFSARGQEKVINFPRAANQTFTTYKVVFPTVANAAIADSMQIAEVKLLAAAAAENATATASAVAITGNGKGFHLDLPASPFLRRAHLYLGVDGGQGNLTLTLSDGSVLPPANTVLVDNNPTGPRLVRYEIDYKSGLDNQTLGVDWVAANGGTVILSAATWIEFIAPSAPASPSATPTSRGKVNISWTDTSSNEQGFKIERAATAAGPYTTVGTTGANVNQFVDAGLNENTQYFYKVSAFNAAATIPASSPVNAITSPFSQTGLLARYWNDEGNNIHNFQNSNPPLVTRVESNINVDWGTGSPAAAINSENFSSQWDGVFIADYTGAHTFFTDTDDGGRFFLDLNRDGIFQWDPIAAGNTLPNGELIVNSWVDQGLGIDGVNNGRGIVINLVAGTAYQILFQQFEHGGGAAAFLYVQTPFGGQKIVDTTNFAPVT